MEEQEHALEMERRRLSELQLGRKNMINRQLNGYGIEDLNTLEGKTFNFGQNTDNFLMLSHTSISILFVFRKSLN